MPTQEQVRDMVDTHVLMNASSLVYNLYADDKYADELMDLMSRPNYEAAAREAGHVVVANCSGWFVVVEEDGEEDFLDGPYGTELQAWEGACDDNGIDPHTDEAYEHWIVSEWMALKLTYAGEMVDNFMGLTIWGRCATGQVIYLDGVMVEICSEIVPHPT